MKAIDIHFTVTEGEYELLRLGKCDKPNPQRVKRMLLSQAISNLTRMGKDVMREFNARERAQMKLAPALVLTKPKGKPNRKPMRTDGSAQWMDDDNLRKLREPDIN